ncbi:MAG: hypothetical protein AAFV53_36525 [Myxococcota bacterium]
MIFFLIACSEYTTYPGVLVGNPGEIKVQTAQTDAGTFRTGSSATSALVLQTCAADITTNDTGSSIDLLGASTIAVPPGEWCRLRLDFDEPLVWTLDTETRTDVPISLEVEQLILRSSGFPADGLTMVLEIGEPGWISLEDIPEEGGISNDPLLIEAVVEGSSLARDDNADGQISDDEPLLAASDEVDAPRPPRQGGGCGNEFELQATDSALMVMAIFGMRFRRRRMPDSS